MIKRRNSIDGQFAAHTIEMIKSPAWSVLSLSARRVLDRIEIEHADHGGNDNGRLPVTYDDFERYGVHCHSIRRAIGYSWPLLVEPNNGVITETIVRDVEAAARPMGLHETARVHCTRGRCSDGVAACGARLHLTSPETNRENLTNFQLGLGDTGYIENKNVSIEYR